MPEEEVPLPTWVSYLVEKIDTLVSIAKNILDMQYEISADLKYVADKLAHLKHASVYIDDLFTLKEIRDTNLYTTDVKEVKDYDVVTFFFINETDAEFEAQVYGNWQPSILGACKIGDPLKIDPNDRTAYTLSTYYHAYLPYVFVQFKAKTAPSKGKFGIKLIKRLKP